MFALWPSAKHGRIVVLFAFVGLTSCAQWPERPRVSALTQAAAVVPGYSEIRIWADAPLDDWQRWRQQLLSDRIAAGNTAPPQLLAISSGSDQGAFAAGYLVGWTAQGDRPEFAIVTGVSTGALIAPFAFLGRSEDETLRQLYTEISRRDVYRMTPISGLLGGPAFANNKPLIRLIERYVTPTLINRIALEHRRGRRLLVTTTNLDAARGVVWDMGAIAASRQPDRVALFRRILLASASIPGLFPPVLIDVSSEGRTFREMHVDGGTTGSLFAIPPAVIWQDADDPHVRAGTLTVLYNGMVRLDYRVVKPTAPAIILRALDTMINAADRQALESYGRYAAENGVTLHLVAIENAPSSDAFFDTRNMVYLYCEGYRRIAPESVAPVMCH